MTTTPETTPAATIAVARWDDGNSIAVTLHPTRTDAFEALAARIRELRQRPEYAARAAEDADYHANLDDERTVIDWFENYADGYERYTVEEVALPEWLGPVTLTAPLTEPADIPVSRCSRGCQFWSNGTEATCSECGDPMGPVTYLTTTQFDALLAAEESDDEMRSTP